MPEGEAIVFGDICPSIGQQVERIVTPVKPAHVYPSILVDLNARENVTGDARIVVHFYRCPSHAIIRRTGQLNVRVAAEGMNIKRSLAIEVGDVNVAIAGISKDEWRVQDSRAAAIIAWRLALRVHRVYRSD